MIAAAHSMVRREDPEGRSNCFQTAARVAEVVGMLRADEHTIETLGEGCITTDHIDPARWGSLDYNRWYLVGQQVDHAWWQWDKLFGSDRRESTAARRLREQREQQRILPAANLPIRPAWQPERWEQEWSAYQAQQQLLVEEQQLEEQQREQQDWEPQHMCKADADAADDTFYDAGEACDQNHTGAIDAFVELSPPVVAQLPQPVPAVPLSWLAASAAAAEAAQRASAGAFRTPEPASRHSRSASAGSDVFERAWSGGSSSDLLVFGDAAVTLSTSQPWSQQKQCDQQPKQQDQQPKQCDQQQAAPNPHKASGAAHDIYTTSPCILRAAALKVLAQRRANARAAATTEMHRLSALKAEQSELSSMEASERMMEASSMPLSASSAPSQYISLDSTAYGSPCIAAADLARQFTGSSLLASANQRQGSTAGSAAAIGLSVQQGGEP